MNFWQADQHCCPYSIAKDTQKTEEILHGLGIQSEVSQV